MFKKKRVSLDNSDSFSHGSGSDFLRPALEPAFGNRLCLSCMYVCVCVCVCVCVREKGVGIS